MPPADERAPAMRMPDRLISRFPSVNVPLSESSYTARGTSGTWMVTGGRLRLSGIAPVARNPGARVRPRAEVWRAPRTTPSR